MKACRILFGFVYLFLNLSTAVAQSSGTIRGMVTLVVNDIGLHNASVRITQLGRVTDTAEDGTYEFRDVPAGTYQVVATMAGMDSASQSVMVAEAGTVTADFTLAFARVRSEITVTASGREELTL